MISAKEWIEFFNVLAKIVNDGRPYSEKAEEVREKAEENAASGDLEEFTGWFAEE